VLVSGADLVPPDQPQDRQPAAAATDQSRERAILSIKIDWADDVAETDCVAGHIGFEL
jgi:hypothetical protein